MVGEVRIRPTCRPYRVATTAAIDPVLPLAPVVWPARAVCDAAVGNPSRSTVRALVTSAVQRGACTVDELAAETRAVPRNGSRFLRDAVLLAGLGARSAAEARAAQLLRRARVPAFEMNAPIVDVASGRRYVADFLWAQLRAVLEIDSREFHLSELEWKATMVPHNALVAMGYAVVHYPPSAVQARGWAPGVRRWLAIRAIEVGATASA